MHNPESEMHKLSQELKEGRQKRIQIIDGQEVVTHVKAEEETEEEEESEMDMEQEEQVMYIAQLLATMICISDAVTGSINRRRGWASVRRVGSHSNAESGW